MKKIFAIFILIAAVAGYWGYQVYNDTSNSKMEVLHPERTKLEPEPEPKQKEEKKIPELGLTGKVALLFDERDGNILYEKNANKRIYPASTTKILTAQLALKYGNLNDRITVGDEVNMKEKGESTAYLVEGQSYTLRELMSGLMLPSGNDAARTIAIYAGKKIEGNLHLSNEKAMAVFVREMNEYADQLGATHSHFVNSNGLHDRNHYTTAYDMAIITEAAMKIPEFMAIVSQSTYRDKNVSYKNTNQLLDPENEHYFEGVDGIKTGFTDEAGRCLVSSIKVDGRHLVALVFDSTNEEVFNDSSALLSAGITYGS
ncbi:D-alanyl-D-alanine carboxypeptidase family protein [Bacillus sp. 1P06AnD]|uniref:D-alanyl-D-alanine carboxypeptidase family protein n=1 Tax=Bacillus sp. 1P06AnD TaxID=3132208 RepID=UPI0039A0E21C